MRRHLLLLLIAAVAASSVAAEEIAWHKGDVQSAFDLAERTDKPLFLYWGAIWCPPCMQIKKTIFTQREFIEKTKLFVPVYLDGDTESAQLWGEKLDVLGYPSMLVLNSAGEEVMRMPTGLQIEAFTRVLDESLSRLTPVAQVLEETLAAKDPDSVPDDDYRLLAYYSWAQDRRLGFSDQEYEVRFGELARRVPEDLPAERSRLYMLWLEAAASLASETEDDDAPFKLSKKQRRQADRRLREILTEPELVLANMESLTYQADSVIPLIWPRPGKSRDALVDRWVETMRSVQADDSLTPRERLSALYPELDLHDLFGGQDATWSAPLLEHVRQRVAWADKASTDPTTRQSVMSTAGYILRRVGLRDEARALYTAEVDKSTSPYYFMSSLGGMASTDGDAELALSWYRRAYESTDGRATRFQWGTSYLLALLELTPEDSTVIRDESLRVFGELLGFDDAFAGRNQSRVNRLASRYATWNADGTRLAEIAAIREALRPGCETLEGADKEASSSESLRDRCENFFEDLGTTATDS